MSLTFDHHDSSTENLTLFIDNKKGLDTLNRCLQNYLQSEKSISVKFTTHREIVAEALNFKNHNDILHSLPTQIGAANFVRGYVKQINARLSQKLSKSYLAQFIYPLLENDLARKKAIVIPVKSSHPEPFYESMGPNEFDQPFPVGIFLDHSDNTLFIQKTPKQYGPAKFAYGIEEMFQISASISGAELNKFLKEHCGLFEALLNECWISWDGYNYVCKSTEKGDDIRYKVKSLVEHELYHR
ncbi:hypothetical protein GCM10011369_19050 [Neiella marina]|uniref:Uncharacterized protein n=1 Tax=Neiella marina TaxID=508461 RepID=A0A8J2U563_9GAMM|nr:hypothetical protein [Neiella marina]GGA77365.1 hypothetical protein GCM10011369_19050 [Neiella marina]